MDGEAPKAPVDPPNPPALPNVLLFVVEPNRLPPGAGADVRQVNSAAETNVVVVKTKIMESSRCTKKLIHTRR